LCHSLFQIGIVKEFEYAQDKFRSSSRGKYGAKSVSPERWKEEYNAAGHLILPDKSLLEEYVKRVFERSPYGVPVITAPSRSVSRVSSVSSGPEPITPTVMLDTLSAYNNFNSTPQGFLRYVGHFPRVCNDGNNNIY
ncbi:hypothetical protein COOONC_12516, partial [Cooperia oncophora]